MPILSSSTFGSKIVKVEYDFWIVCVSCAPVCCCFGFVCAACRVNIAFCVAENCVCIPRGTHPVVRRFLALHKNLFPLKALKDLDHNRVRYSILVLTVFSPTVLYRVRGVVIWRKYS